MRSVTSSLTSILSSASSRASTEPETSPLRMSLSSWTSPFSSALRKSSSVRRPRACASAALRSRASRVCAIWRAMRSSSTTRKLSPAPGTEVRPSTCTGRDGLASVERVAVLVEHGADATVGVAGHDRVTRTQRAALHQHRGDRTATAVEVRLDRRRPGRPGSGLARRSSAASAVRSSGVEQSRRSPAGLGRDVDEHRVAAVLLGHQAVLGELAAHLDGIGALLVDLVDRDHDRHVGRLGVVERLDGLRLHAVVGRHHEDRDVGDLCATGTHGGERLVTRGVDEGDGSRLVGLGRATIW